MILPHAAPAKPGGPLLVAGIIVYLFACAVAVTATFAYDNPRALDACVILLTFGFLLALWPLASRGVDFKRKLAGLPVSTPLDSAMKRNWRAVTGGFLLASVLAAGAAAIFGLPS
jgi:hypothetical protein